MSRKRGTFTKYPKTPEGSLAQWLEYSLAAVMVATDLAARREPVIFGSAVQRWFVGELRAEVRMSFQRASPFAMQASIEIFDHESGARIGEVFHYDPAGASVARESLNKCGSHGVSTDERGNEA